jgi:hypothetical protein
MQLVEHRCERRKWRKSARSASPRVGLARECIAANPSNRFADDSGGPFIVRGLQGPDVHKFGGGLECQGLNSCVEGGKLEKLGLWERVKKTSEMM